MKAKCCYSTLASTVGSKIAALVSPRSAFSTMPPAKSWLLSSSPPNMLAAISACSANCCAAAVSRSLLRRSHGIFVRNDDHWSVEEQLAGKRQPTQFGRALEQLGVTFIAARSPQAKGRIERLWGIFQDRLSSELRLARAADLDSANEVLRGFLPDYNRRFSRAPRDMQYAWRPAPQDLDRICCFGHERVVSNDNVVQWDGRRLQIPPPAQRFSFAGAKVHVYRAVDGRDSLYYGDTRLQYTLAPPG